MPQARLTSAVADATAVEIEAMRTEGLFTSYPFVATATIQSKKLPRQTLPQLSSMIINASPYSRATKRASRNSTDQELGVLLMVMMRYDGDEQFDKLVDFVNDLDDLLPWRKLNIAGRSISWANSDNNPLYDLDVAYTQKVFRSLLTVNWQGFVN